MISRRIEFDQIIPSRIFFHPLLLLCVLMKRKISWNFVWFIAWWRGTPVNPALEWYGFGFPRSRCPRQPSLRDCKNLTGFEFKKLILTSGSVALYLKKSIRFLNLRVGRWGCERRPSRWAHGAWAPCALARGNGLKPRKSLNKNPVICTNLTAILIH